LASSRPLTALGSGVFCAVALTGLAAGCSHEVESPEVKLDHLEPDLICGDQFPADGLLVNVHGDGFTPMPLNVLDKPGLELPAVSLSRVLNLDGTDGDALSLNFPGVSGQQNADHLGWTSKQLMTLRFDDSVKPEPGLYSVTVTNPDRVSKATLPVGLGVVPPPTITGPDPLAYCNAAEDGTLTLEGTNFIQVGDTTPTITLTGPDTFTFSAATLDGCTALEGLSEPVQICSEATFPIPGGTLPGGEYDVTLTNPDPVGCSSTESIKLTVLAEGPILFYSDPPVAYSGINTKITLFLTAVTSPATVTIDDGGEETELDSNAVSGRDNRLQATVPMDTGETSYAITVTDGLGCTTTLEDGLVVTNELTLSLSQITPSFGHEPESTPVTILRDTEAAAPADVEFAATPRGFLNPADAGEDDVAIQLESLTFVDGDRLTAVVPENTPVGTYDLVIVNPGGEVGLLEDAFVSVEDAPPKVADIVPQSVVDQADQSITLIGTNFRDPTVTASCVDGAGDPIEAPAASAGTLDCDDDQNCTLTATIDGGALSPGSVCVVRVTNADGSYADFSAIGVTNSSFNLAEPREGADLTIARRALGSAAVKATSASRFVYAIAGDSGDISEPLASVEFAPIDVFGAMSDFVLNPASLAEARSFAGTATVGRYVYVFGGSDGADALASGERALVLSPEETPVIEDLDLCLADRSEGCWDDEEPGPGLDPGGYAYRVSALIDGDDVQNLGGETLASDPIVVKLPDLGRKILVQLTWSAPLDDQGEVLTGITGYRIYRIPRDGVPGKDEVLLGEVEGADTLQFVDDGTLELGTATPLPLGSTSAWQALPDLGTARMGHAGAAARDPSDPDTWYVYALLGKDNGAETGGAALDSYEFLEITALANGRQTVGASWTDGSQSSSVGRWKLGAWTVDSVISSEVTAPDTFVYLGGGSLADNNGEGTVEAGLVEAGGDLGAFSLPGSFSNARVGYGTAAAAGRLFCFGGNAPGPKNDATAALIESPAPTLAGNSWNNEGLQLTIARHLPGSSIQSAFIFLLGGETDNSGAVTTSTETVVW
jgi:hypothetical protein